MILVLFGERPAASFYRINDFVAFSCHFCSWTRAVWEEPVQLITFFSQKLSFSGNSSAEFMSTSAALVSSSVGSYQSYTRLLLRAVWLHDAATARGRQRARLWQRCIMSPGRKQSLGATCVAVCAANTGFLSLKCPYFHCDKRLWDMTAIIEQEVISSADQLNACAYIMHDVCVRKKKRDSGKRRASSLAELLSSLNVPKWVLGKRKPCGFWRINKPVSFGCV